MWDDLLWHVLHTKILMSRTDANKQKFSLLSYARKQAKCEALLLYFSVTSQHLLLLYPS